MTRFVPLPLHLGVLVVLLTAAATARIRSVRSCALAPLTPAGDLRLQLGDPGGEVGSSGESSSRSGRFCRALALLATSD